ncbi:hypothetical protein GIB67_028487 [Kingdonia uniflora]|uniref:Transposase-associated domain-containing protein n=1 Tax=Kingdonia uniflora TaxID=39325 RepID=A0A7J7P166_9MAGN|nr:hypothetical protein GIB67_028487 [Kingdonia uniflora]
MSSANLNKNWMKASRLTYDFLNGVRSLIDYVKQTLGDMVYCPCNKFHNVNGVKTADKIRTHLITYGIDQSYTTWYFHGESRDATVDAHIQNPNESLITQHDDVERPRMFGLVDDAFGYIQPEDLNEGTEDGSYEGVDEFSEEEIEYQKKMRTYKDYVKNPKRVEGCIANRYVLDEAILYCMEYIPNGRKGTHKYGRPTFMDDDADKEKPLDKGNAIHLETLKMISPSQLTPSLPNPSDPLPIPAGGSHDEHSTTSGGDSSKIKIPLKLSLLGHVVGKNSTKFMSHLGNLVREHIPPYYPDWPAVPDRFKDTVWQIIWESEEAEYEVIVDIIFEQGSPVFGQRGVFFDELLIGTKIKYPRILLPFGY